MRIYHRPYDEQQNDFHRMWAFLVDDYADRRDRFVWHPARLGDWNTGLWSVRKYFPSFKRKNARLWVNDFGELLGFIISENCGDDFAVLVRKGYEFMYSEMIEWVKAHWSDRGDELSTEVHEFQPGLMQCLEQAGLARQERVATTWRYSVQDKAAEPVGLDSGFRIVDMLSYPDFAGKKRLHNNGFENRNEPLTEFDLLQYEYARENPCYYPHLDLSVVDGSGVHASTCTAFVDRRNGVAEIEKVCTHSDLRKRGLAEAVIRECFGRLHEEGIKTAYITGYSKDAKSVYARLGAAGSKDWVGYGFKSQAGREKD